MKTEKKQKPTFILSRKLHGPTQPDYLYLYLAGTGGGDVCIHESRLCLAPGDILLFSGALALKTEDSASDSRTDSRLLGFLSERADEHIGPLLFEQNDISRFLFRNSYVYHYEDYLVISAKDDPVPREIIDSMETELAAQRPYRTDMLIHLFCILMTHLVREHGEHCQREIPAPISEEGYRIFTDIINSDFRLTLSDIASSCHIAPSYASRYVRQHTGLSFSALLSGARDYVACLMLTTTPKSIRSITAQVGYDTPENFVRAFKKKHGVTPSEYRSRGRDAR